MSCYSAVSFSHVCITSYLVGGMQLKIKTAVNPVILAMCCLMCTSVSTYIVSTYMEAISVRASSYQSDNWAGLVTKMHVACS